MPDWTAWALCTQADPEAFFPEQGVSSRAARKVCRNCPVQAECLAYSLIAPERFGVWGGLSAQARKRRYPEAFAPQRERRGATPPGCGTEDGYHRHKAAGEPIDSACRSAAWRARAARDKALAVAS